jgi:hypothetical protein
LVTYQKYSIFSVFDFTAATRIVILETAAVEEPAAELEQSASPANYIDSSALLSALIHIFQRNALVRRWHADFPALRTEGGVPGSESAGVVAFIRERLINIDEEPPTITKNDRESQNSDFDQMINGSRVSIPDANNRTPLIR